MIGKTLTFFSALVLSILTNSCGSKAVELINRHYGDDTMSKKILVAYATRAGSTMEVADSLGKVIAESGCQVDVLPVKKVKSTEGYDAVVLGTAVRMGKIMPEIVSFTKKNKAKLGKLPVAAFVVCLTMKDDTPENRKTVSAYLDPVKKEVGLADEGLFAGKLDVAKLGFFSRFIMTKMVKTPDADHRDWKKIREWGAKLFQKN
jgi:menaquinone-dependent protoporphyrinogen oxidase